MSTPVFVDQKTKEIFDSTFKVKKLFQRNGQHFEITSVKGEPCLLLSIDIETGIIDVNSLEKCDAGDAGKGNALLHRVDSLASLIPEIHSIKLTDESQVSVCHVVIHFSTLRILTTGMSWYNQHGYHSVNAKDEVEHNKSIITQPFYQMLDRAFQVNWLNFVENNSREKITELMRRAKVSSANSMSSYWNDKVEQYQTILDNYDAYMRTMHYNMHSMYHEILYNDVFTGVPVPLTHTVKSYVTGVLNSIGMPVACDSEQMKRAELLKKIVDFMKSLIMYNPVLIKQCGKRGGGKRRRMQTRRNNKKGHKKAKEPNPRK
jgi:hypothetical protein